MAAVLSNTTSSGPKIQSALSSVVFGLLLLLWLGKVPLSIPYRKHDAGWFFPKVQVWWIWRTMCNYHTKHCWIPTPKKEMRTAPDPHFILSDLGAPGQRWKGRKDCDIKFLRVPLPTCRLKDQKLSKLRCSFMTYFVEIKNLKPWYLKVEVFMRASDSARHLGWLTVASLIHIILKKNVQPRLNLAIRQNKHHATAL